MREWYPRLIQGGMGIGVSLSELAQAVSLSDKRALGVVSGVGLREVFVRKLQLGDPGGGYRRALKYFPGNRQIVKEVLEKYYRPDGLKQGEDFARTPAHSDKPSKLCLTLDVLASFCEVWLAKNVGKGKKVRVGFNLLEKTQTTLVPELFGAMLAGVDFVLMGAGIPFQIPNVLTRLSHYDAVEYRLTVEKATPEDRFSVDFDPELFDLGLKRKLKRPKFLAIVSSYVLAVKMQDIGVDGLIFENYTAGGHNAPPRGKAISLDGSPLYSEKDEVDWEKVMRDIHVPYYLAGSFSTREDRWEIAGSVGAEGIQAGSIFALSDQSNITEKLKAKVRISGFLGTQKIRTDGRFSSSGYPFKVAIVSGTLSDPVILEDRERRCNLHFLRSAYKREDGSLGWRCPAEPESHYLAKEGKIEDCQGRGCLCNGLLSTIGLGGVGELPVVTLGDDLGFLKKIMNDEADHYSAEDAVKFLLKGIL